MKRIYLILAIITFSFSNINTNAQTYFGFKVGANLANINGDNTLKGIKPAMHVGGIAEIIMSDFISIQPELLYSMQGSQKKMNLEEYKIGIGERPRPQDEDIDVSIKNNNHYIILPIMVRYFVTETISIDAGPQLGYLLFAKTSNGSQEWTDNKKFYNTFDYGFNLGGSYEFDNGMNINIRYNYGFAKVFKTDGLKSNNSNIQISLGYKFY